MESKEEEIMQRQSNKEDDGNEPQQVEKSIGEDSAAARVAAANEVLIIIPGAILNLVDKKYSMPLARGDLCITRLSQEDKIASAFVRVADQVQWPLAKQGAVVKLDGSHYFFSLPLSTNQQGKSSDFSSSATSSDDDDDDEKKDRKKEDENKDRSTDDEEEEEEEENEILSYGLTVNEVEEAGVLKQFEEILKIYTCFFEEKVSEKAKKGVQKAIEKSASRLWGEDEEDMMEKKSALYWTAMAPNVDQYSSSVAKLIASGSSKLVDKIQWCGDVTVNTLNWVNQVTEKRMHTKSKSQISPSTLRRIRRVKRLTRNTEKVVTGVLYGAVKLTELFTLSVVNSSVGKKFVSLAIGEAIVASLDAFNKVSDAVEEAGKKIMTTSSLVATQLVQRRYGDAAAEATGEGLDAAGHALGTAWAAFNVRKALNPVSVLKPKAKELEENKAEKRKLPNFKPKNFAKSSAKAVADMTAKYDK